MTGSGVETLGAQLEDSIPELSHPTDRMSSIGRRVRRRKRMHLALGTASIAAVVAVGIAAVPVLSGLGRPDNRPALGSSSATSLRTADWTRAVIDLPATGGDGCPTGRTVLSPKTYDRFGTVGEAAGDPAKGERTFQVLAGQKAFGDLTGDGREEAVVHVRCTQAPDGNLMVDEGSKLLVVEYTGGGSVRGLGYIGPQHAQFPRYWVADEKLYVEARYQQVSSTNWSYNQFDVGYRRSFVWHDGTFRQVDGRTTPLTFEPDSGRATAPIGLADILDGNTVVCGKQTLTLRSRSVLVGSATYTVQPIAVVDVDRDGNDEVLASVRCRSGAYDAVSVYLFRQSGDGFVPLDVPVANNGRTTVESVGFAGGKLTVKVDGDAGKRTTSMSWNGHRFTPAIGSYRR